MLTYDVALRASLSDGRVTIVDLPCADDLNLHNSEEHSHKSARGSGGVEKLFPL